MPENYQTIIGLEIHVELGTKSKMFCRCQNPTSADFAQSRDNPNSFVCPICLGHPGTLPVINKEAIARTIKVGLALNSEIAEFTKFDRKHYFYPDLPKGYQISQYDMPLVVGGELEITRRDNSTFKVRLIRIHLEEDAGKLVHPEGSQASLVDLNRAGVPLMEIVTEPDITSAEDARLFLQELRLLMRYLGVSDADMEKGQLRCDANINVKCQMSKVKSMEEEFKTPITEIKNLNSFRMVERALVAEAERQYQEWEDGGAICQRKNKITVGWNDASGKIVPQREKEEANDYRYFSEPDLPPIKIKSEILNSKFETNSKSEIRNNATKVKIQSPNRSIEILSQDRSIEITSEDLPELPDERRKRYLNFSLSSADVDTLVTNREKGDYFDKIVHKGDRPELVKKVASTIINELSDISINPDNLQKFAELLLSGDISSKIGKDLLLAMSKEDKSPEVIMEEKGWKQLNDQGEIESIIDKVIVDNAKIVADYKAGKMAAIGFLIGVVMKESGGQANPKVVKEMLEIKSKVKNQKSKL